MSESCQRDALGWALLTVGAVVVGVLALTERFHELAVAVGAYAGAGWVLVLERCSPRSGDRR